MYSISANREPVTRGRECVARSKVWDGGVSGRATKSEVVVWVGGAVRVLKGSPFFGRQTF